MASTPQGLLDLTGKACWMDDSRLKRQIGVNSSDIRHALGFVRPLSCSCFTRYRYIR